MTYKLTSKKLLRIIFIVLICFVGGYAVGKMIAHAAAGNEKIALAGSGVTHVAIIDKATGTLEWRYELPEGSECNTVAVTEDGNVLLSYKKGVRLVDRTTKTTLWDFTVPEGQEAQTARLIDDQKRVLVGVCAVPEMRIVELDAATGNVLFEVGHDLEVPYAHSQFRQIWKTQAGNYLIPIISKGRVVEVDARGQKIGEWAVPSTPFSVKEINDGKTLLVSSFGSLIEIDRSAPDTIRVVGKRVIGNDTMRFGTEAHRQDNGHTIWANWQGYKPESTDAQLIEWDDKGQITYRLADTSVMRFVSGFYLFEE